MAITILGPFHYSRFMVANKPILLFGEQHQNCRNEGGIRFDLWLQRLKTNFPLIKFLLLQENTYFTPGEKTRQHYSNLKSSQPISLHMFEWLSITFFDHIFLNILNSNLRIKNIDLRKSIELHSTNKLLRTWCPLTKPLPNTEKMKNAEFISLVQNLRQNLLKVSDYYWDTVQPKVNRLSNRLLDNVLQSVYDKSLKSDQEAANKIANSVLDYFALGSIFEHTLSFDKDCDCIIFYGGQHHLLNIEYVLKQDSNFFEKESFHNLINRESIQLDENSIFSPLKYTY